MTQIVTVAIPVLNGAEYLDEALAAVRSQVVEAEVELLVVDSGSTDGSLEIARRYEAHIHEIPAAEFSHGGTRNLMMELARGDRVAFLTQDATPAHDRWLDSLLQGFEAAPRVGAVFGPHDARPAASHVLKAEMERHFANWGEGQEVDVQTLDRSPKGLAAYRAEPWRFTFLSSVNCCLAREAWERVPFREVPYAEDQLLGRDLIEAGYAKVFQPEACVLHSHHYRPFGFLRRYFDEFRGLREVLGYREPAGAIHVVRSIRALYRSDKMWLRRHGVRGVRLAWALGRSLLHHTIRLVGAILGSRAGRLSPRARRSLSLERRSSFEPIALGESPLLQSDPLVDVRADWGWEFVRSAYPAREVVLEPRSGWPHGATTSAWIVPPWGIGSGGHAVIFRLIAELERRGHSCAIFVFDPFGWNTRPGAALREEISDNFTPIKAQVFVGLDDFDSADVAVATNWWTAYPVRDLPRCREKVYLVQDHEPSFYPASAEALWAEETYGMGYRCVAYTPWLAALLRDQYELEVAELDCGTDLKTYTFAGEEEREPGLIAVYARLETPRRAVELAVAGLATLIERRPGVQVVLFGSPLPQAVPFPCRNLGVVPPSELAALYRRASAGVVFSLTNLSLVTQEMMASGLPVVELEGENVASVLGSSSDLAMLAAPRPDAVAAALTRLLDDPEGASEMARRARAFVEERTWEHASRQLEESFRTFLATGRPQRRKTSRGLALSPPKLPEKSVNRGPLSHESAPVTEALFSGVDEAVERAVAERARADSTIVDRPYARPGKALGPVRISDVWADALSRVDRKRLTLALSVHYGFQDVLELTGLTSDAPPENVHSTSRGPLASGGSIYHADLVVHALDSAGTRLTAGERVLDFGCSSGRVARVLQAAFPEVGWYGCDPLESAIAWAKRHLRAIEFTVSPIEPPLAYPDSFFDAAYAISIWSHFARGAALRWLDEMHRIIKPGGALVLTAHGFQTLAFYAEHGLYPDDHLAEIRDDLYSNGFHFEPVVATNGDWALRNPEWGMAFLSTEWLLANACPQWRVVDFAAGRNEENQDVFVLERSDDS